MSDLSNDLLGEFDLDELGREKIPVSFEQRIAYAAGITWDVIGDDILSAMEREGKDPTLSRAGVIELVMDADNILSCGRLTRADQDLYRALSPRSRVQMVSVAFKNCATYGW